MKLNQALLFSKETKIFPNAEKLYFPTSDKFGKKTFSGFNNRSFELSRVFAANQEQNIKPKNTEFVSYAQLQAYDVPWAGEKKNSPFSPQRQGLQVLKAAGNQIMKSQSREQSFRSSIQRKYDQKQSSQQDSSSQLHQSFNEENQIQNDFFQKEQLEKLEVLIGSRLKILEQEKHKMQEIEGFEENILKQKAQHQNEIDKIIQEIENLKMTKQNFKPNLRYQQQNQQKSIFSNQSQKYSNKQSLQGATQPLYALNEQNINEDFSNSLNQIPEGLQTLAGTRRMRQLLPKSGEKINHQQFQLQDYQIERRYKGSQKGYTDTRDLIV